MTTFANAETLALHAGPRMDPTTGAVAVPIYQTTAYQFRDTEHATSLFALKEIGHIYSRITNPTLDALEQKMSALEGGVAAMSVSSGQAATALAVQNICHAGDNIVVSTDIYGGTWNLFAHTFKAMGIEARFVDPANPEAFRKATDKRTRAYFAESLPNPKLTMFPIADVADIGRELGVPLIMDNTACPVICKPFDHGAAIIVHSTTKYVGGHGTAIGGVVIDGGNFDWEKHAVRFPMLNQPDPTYHGVVWTEAVKPLGPIAYLLKARATLQRDLGMSMSPFNAFQFIQGLETLALRMREHSRNATAVAEYLARHASVSRVIHPGFHKDAELKRRTATYLKGGMGGLVGFELKDGMEAGMRFIDNLRMFYHVANIGDVRSLAIHPASTTHAQLTETEQLATGVTPGYIRLSVGIEHIDDIIADLDQALASATVKRAKAA